ncbi:hypothetical protein GGI25_003879 [Coemansia spiralis]|uniref:SART-1 protein n=2 Tax=Coemansia TaxID=4863 RepID=A0A9W8G7N8_9FUNG|nr:hypothetical protein EDC05_003675 [Coemansia umbellata]KAJ2621114.1 hypothetical protein GGI26_004377 [Coemansia sp. RSA 1358]KAJ2675681.1 hypothetical protein GGI25_003879 [Coemansia spiralis]
MAGKPSTVQKKRQRPTPTTPAPPNASDDDSLDALKWIERSRQRQKELSGQKSQPDNEKQQLGRQEYSADDLAGIKVAHDISKIAEGSEQVLTLQDRTIDELDDQEETSGLHLQNIELADIERARKNAENRARAHPLYGAETAHDVIEKEADTQSFVIGASGIIKASEQITETTEEKAHREMREQLGQTAASLDISARQITDFYTEEEATSLFRKPKKAKKNKKEKRRNGKTTSLNDLEEEAPGVDADLVNSILTRQTRIDDSNFIDDDEDLQRAIASVRRVSALKQKHVSSAEEIARQVREESSADGPAEATDLDGSSLVLSSTIEFVQSLKAAVSSAADDNKMDVETQIVKSERKPQPSGDNALEQPAQHSRKGIVVSTKAPKESTPEPTEEEPQLAEEEPSVGAGLSATLRLLRQRNMIDKLSAEQRERERLQRDRDTWVAEQRQRDLALQTERQRIKQLGRGTTLDPSRSKRSGRGKPDELTQKELEELKAREQEALDRKWAREYEDRMRDYKPDVKLEYFDETGRQLSTKEAYKQLSHAFHGHYSGKNKIDKLVQKRERERKQMELTSTSTTHEHGAALENVHKKLGAAGIVMTASGKTEGGSRAK